MMKNLRMGGVVEVVRTVFEGLQDDTIYIPEFIQQN